MYNNLPYFPLPQHLKNKIWKGLPKLAGQNYTHYESQLNFDVQSIFAPKSNAKFTIYCWHNSSKSRSTNT